MRLIPVLFTAALLPGTAAAHVLSINTCARFVDAAGVNMRGNYADTPYWIMWDSTSSYMTSATAPYLKRLLIESGVRHIRDGVHWEFSGPNGGARRTVNERYRELARTRGFRLLSGIAVGSPAGLDTSKIDTVLDIMLRDSMLQFTDYITGPNEYDISNPFGNGFNNSSWAPDLERWTRACFQKVRARRAFDSIPIVMGALAHENVIEAIPPLWRWIDYGSAHPYALNPWDGDFVTYLRRAQVTYAGRPLMITEDGCNTNWRHGGVSEAVSGPLTQRLLLHRFRRGIVRDYLFQLVDFKPYPDTTRADELYGLIAVDSVAPGKWQLRPKPGYYAVKNLLSFLADGIHEDTLPCAIGIAHSSMDLDALTLRKKDGSVVLLLWRETAIWNATAKQEIPVPTTPVVIRPLAPVTSIEVWSLGSSTPGPEKTATFGIVDSFALSVPAQPVAVVITYSAPSTPRRVIVDSCADPSIAASVRGWQVDTTSPVLWNGDKARFKVARTADNAVIYHAPEATAFSVTAGFTVQGSTDRARIPWDSLSFATAPDTAGPWTPIPVSHLFFDQTELPWYSNPSYWKTQIGNSRQLPADTRYLRIVSTSGSTNNAARLLSVAIVCRSGVVGPAHTVPPHVGKGTSDRSWFDIRGRRLPGAGLASPSRPFCVVLRSRQGQPHRMETVLAAGKR